MQFDLLIPTHGSLTPLEALIRSVVDEEVRPTRLVILIWKELTAVAVQEFSYSIQKMCDNRISEVVILHTHYSDHQPGRGVGYDRQFLLQHATSEWLCMIDEDNVLPPHFFRDLIAGYQDVIRSLGHEAIVSPTIMRDGQIQSQGIVGFSYLFPKYIYGHLSDRPRYEVQMLGANSLFGRTEIFQRIGFDPRFEGSYEDIDFTTRAAQSGVSVVVLRDVQIDHREKEKSFLETLFLATPRSAYLRSRNRILRVRKTAQRRQKIAYFTLGVRIQTAARMWYIWRSDTRTKRELFHAIWQGVRDGITQ